MRPPVLRWLETAPPWLLALAAALVALALHLPFLGASDFIGDDEALDAAVVVDMVERGHWLFPEPNGDALPPKPPLYYWAAAAASELHGAVDEWSVRLPSVLCAAATVGISVAAGTRLVGAGPALLGGLLLAVMPVFRAQARVGRTDMMMTLLVSAWLLVFRLAPEPLGRGRRWLLFTLLGLASLTKGAAGIGLVVAVVIAEVALAGERRAALRSLLDPAVLAFALVGGGWYVAALAHWGWPFFRSQIVAENLGHFFGGWVAGKPGLRGLVRALSHFVNVFTVALPWSLILPLAIRDLWRTRRTRASGGVDFLARWGLAGLVFFTLASRKSPYYLLPLTPPMALLAAWWLWPSVRSVGEDAAEPPAHNRGRVALAAWAAAACVVVLADAVEGPLARRQSLRPFAATVAREVPADQPLFFFELRLPAVSLYARRRIPTLEASSAAPAAFYLVVPESLERRLPDAWRRGAREIAAGRARVFTRSTMGIRLYRMVAAPPASGAREGGG